MRTIVISILLCYASCILAQVRVDKPIVLTGATPNERQVTGLMNTGISGELISAGVEQSGIHRYAVATPGAIWQVDLPALTAAPTPGTQIVVRTPVEETSGAVVLSMNTFGQYPVLITPGHPLLADAQGMPDLLSLVFDGTSFHVLNGSVREHRDCPTGMVSVSDQYCIELTDRDTSTFYEAARTCVGEDRRLCTWGEWYAACSVAATIGLTGMIGQWEWTNDSSNEDEWVRMAGGGNGCTSAGNSDAITGPKAFRCCYTR